MYPIPFEITKTIFSRLPPTTLVRFRLACKQWESTICDREFRCPSVSRFLFTVCNRVDLSLRFFASPPTSEIVGDSFSLEALGELTLPDDFCFTENQWLAIIHGVDPASGPIQFPMVESVHGLIILENKDSVVIYNPTTREKKVLPDADPPVPRDKLGKTILHYDPPTDKYICIRFQCHEDGHLDGRVIGLEDSEWSKLLRPPEHQNLPWFGGFDPCSAAYLGDALYLVNPSGSLVRFHTSSLTFERVKPPPALHREVSMRVLFVYQGKIAITSRLMENTYDRCLFTLEDQLGNVWNPVNFFAQATTRNAVKQCEKRGITEGGEIILVKRYMSAKMQKDILYYDPRSGALRVSVAQGTSMSNDDFKRQFGEPLPRALIHTNHVDHLTFFN